MSSMLHVLNTQPRKPMLLLHTALNGYSWAIAGGRDVMLGKDAGAAPAPQLVFGVLHILHMVAGNARHETSSEHPSASQLRLARRHSSGHIRVSHAATPAQAWG